MNHQQQQPRQNMRFYSHQQMMKQPSINIMHHDDHQDMENRVHGHPDNLGQTQQQHNGKSGRKFKKDSNKNMKYVNPFIGTGKGFGSGTMSPMAQTPYGMIRVGPDTTNTFDLEISFEHPGGFYYPDDYIHICVWAYNKETQFVQPGYFRTTLERYDIDEELTSGYYSGIHRYTFNDQSKESFIILDISHTIDKTFLKGQLRSSKINMQKTYQAMKKTSNEPVNYVGRVNPAQYNSLGFVPEESAQVGAVLTLDYSYEDSCIASVAKVLNETADYLNFTARSQFYKNVWHEKEQFFCPKSISGKWNCPELTFADGWDSDAWHYRFFVPHDIPRLISLFGSKEKFTAALEQFAKDSFDFPFTVLPNPFYWGGNEHDLMSMYLFNYVDRADLTQYYVRQMMDRLYSVNPDGLPGNNDYGTMSAWFVWSALGLYPRAGSSEYFVGSPLFESIQVERENGCFLSIESYNFKPDSPKILKVVLNGQVLTRPFIDHSQLNCVNGKNSVKLEYFFA
ncbi:predicted protein [Naegleria gruberi]|uniref:Predicted protein n=1 Tax=Naegleria gruberi TaxID=5762 RepID=D2VS46_NAEGR|nr:uncharacterized protein NAEGRDRAFT_71809 [Naegleria gruberi]EFC40361.1 predicted protein [Naegleria gruberi]|eukprot:XP_002673105.1 predicted protein [Naegleria gruberi strain NEG-M]